MSATAPDNPPAGANARLLLTPYLAPVYALCFRLLNHPDLADDATQETFLAAVKLWPTFVPPAQPLRKDPRLQWLLAIAARRALELRRQTARQPQTLESAMEPQHEQTPSADAERAEAIAHLEQALQDLPDEQRELVILHHVAGLSQAEIAATLAIPPRTVSHRITDGVAQLHRRLTREGFAGLATSSLSFALLPAPTPPPDLAASLFSHPEILSWSSSAAATTTAATASTASAGVSAGGNAAAGSSLSTTLSAKGATLMSSKFVLAASAVVCGAVLIAWATGALTAPPPAISTTPPTPSGRPAATAAPLAAVTHPLPPPTPPATARNKNTPGTAPAGANPDRAVAWESAYAHNLATEQAAARAALRAAFHAPLARNQDRPGFGTASWETLPLNTTVGAFQLQHFDQNGRIQDDLQLLPAGDGTVKPFAWGEFEVQHSSAAQSQSGLLGQSRQSLQVTSCGRPTGAEVRAPEMGLTLVPAAVKLTAVDLWPAAAPAHYDAATVLTRCGLALTADPTLTRLLAAAEQADTAFVSAAQAWAAAKTGADTATSARCGANAWQAAHQLTAAQAAVCLELEKYLHDTQSGLDAWALLSIATSHDNGLRLPGTDAVTLAAAANPANPASPTDGETHTTTTTVLNGQPATPNTPTAAAFGAVALDLLRGVAAETFGARPTATHSQSLILEIHGETLAHLAQVINQNPNANGSILVDPAVMKNAVEGTVTATSLQELAAGVARLAKVECRPAGAHGWQWLPAAKSGDTGEGF